MSIKWKLKIIEWIVYSLHTYIAYKLITYFVPNNDFLFFISLAIIPATWSFSENKFLFPMKIQWLKYYIKNAMKNNENLNITFTQISQKNYQVTISVENQTLAEIFHKKIKNKTRYRYQDPLERLIRRRGSCDKKEILSLLFKNKLKEHSIVQIINDIELLTIHNIDPEKQRQSISCTCRYGHSD